MAAVNEINDFSRFFNYSNLSGHNLLGGKVLSEVK